MNVWDIELKLKPFDLGAIMKATGKNSHFYKFMKILRKSTPGKSYGKGPLHDEGLAEKRRILENADKLSKCFNKKILKIDIWVLGIYGVD